MFDSAVLEVAIGMVVVYLLLSLAASALVEAWMEFFQRRGRLLHSHIHRLIGADAAATLYADARVLSLMSRSDSFAALKDWLIFDRVMESNYPDRKPRSRWVLFRERQKDRLRKWLSIGSGPVATDDQGQDKPSRWIVALQRIRHRMLQRVKAPAVVGEHDPVRRIRAASVNRLPSYIPETVFADVVLGWHRDDRTGVLRAPSSASSEGRLIPLQPDLIDGWNQLFRDANGDPQAYRDALAAWLAHANDRLTGHFRRKTRLGLLLLGLLLAVVFDAGTPNLVNRLFSDQQLREQLAAAGDALAASTPAGERATLPSTPAERETLARRLAEASDGLLWIPGRSRHAHSIPAIDRQLPWADLLMQGSILLLGYLLTAFAVSLGASFWFGALQKVIAIRKAHGAVQSPEPTAESPTTTAERRPANAPERPFDLRDTAADAARAFDPNRFEEGIGQAYYLAHCAYLAYLDRPDLDAHPAIEALGLARRELFASGGCEAWHFESDSHCVFAFRGTEKALDDFRADLDFVLSPHPDDRDLLYHRGFADYLDQLWAKQIEPRLRELDHPVWFTGHSLGGALAVLAAFRWARQVHAARARVAAGDTTDSAFAARRIGGVYTFGQPRVGDRRLRTAYDRLLGGRTFRYVNHCDVVPTLPPEIAAGWRPVHDVGAVTANQAAVAPSAPSSSDPLRYEHVGAARYFDAIGQLHTERDVMQRLLDRWLPPVQTIAGWDHDSWRGWVKDRARQHVGDHSMLEYVRLLAGVCEPSPETTHAEQPR